MIVNMELLQPLRPKAQYRSGIEQPRMSLRLFRIPAYYARYLDGFYTQRPDLIQAS